MEFSQSAPDVAFRKAIKALDFKGIERALSEGADPNGAIPHEWEKSQGYSPCYRLISNFDQRDLKRSGLSEEEFAKAHASALRAMLAAGADFSGPFFIGSNAQCADPATQLWRSWGRSNGIDGSMDMSESVALYVKGNGAVKGLFGEGQFCGLLHSGALANNPEALEKLWQAGWRERVEALGMKTTILTKLIGYGHLEGARWLAAKGVKPAPLIEMGPTCREEPDQTALHLLAVDSLMYSPAPGAIDEDAGWRTLVSVERAIECARFAVELGVDPNALARGATAAHFALLCQGQANPAGVAEWVLELHRLGAQAIPTAKGIPFLGIALRDPNNAEVKLEAALAMGCDPKKDGAAAALQLLNHCGPAQDKIAEKILGRLLELGADLSEGPSVHANASLQAAAAAAGAAGALRLLYDAGCDPAWTCPKTGLSVAAIVCERGDSAKRDSFDDALALAIERKAPLESPGGEGLSALHWSARHLDERKCEALLKAGANPNQKTAKGDAPLHWACARHGERYEKRQKKTLAAFLASPKTDWGLTDKKGRAPLAILSKKASPEILKMAAGVSPDGLDAGSSSGAQALKRLSERGDGALAAVESAILGVSAEAPAKKPGRSRKGAL